MSILADWAEPNNPAVQADYDARDSHLEKKIGFWINPLVFGDYSDAVKALYGDALPTFTQNEMVEIQGSYDFLGVEHYSTWLVCIYGLGQSRN